MLYVLIATLCLFGSGTVALLRAQHEVPRDGRVGHITLALMLLGFFGAGITTILAAINNTWPIPLGSTAARILGGLIGLGGIAIILAARLQFTFRRAWGLDFDKLITTGIYRWSRNPQIIGWFLMYVGVALLGRSAAALLIAGLFWIAFIPWVLAEERTLESRFGDGYARYRRLTPRFI